MQRRSRYPRALTTTGSLVGRRLVSPGYLNGQVYRFKRKYSSTITALMNGPSGATESHGAFTFKLSDLPAYAEFTALFDKYRIAGIRAQFLPRTNVLAQTDIGTSALTAIPPIVTVVDYDDATGIDFSSLYQYENAKVHSEFKPFSVYFKPMIAVAAYNGSFTGYGSSRKMWIDAATADVQYYALKWATLPYSSSNSQTNDPTWDVIFTYYIECKYPR